MSSVSGTAAASTAKFDQLFAAGREALLTGTHRVESEPAENGPRWGIGAALRPDPRAAQRIEAVARTAAAAGGGPHWLAGAARSSHLTFRAGLEGYRSRVPAGDPRVARYADALHRAARGIGPIRFTVTGLTLTPVSVMACAVPADTAADDLAAAFRAVLAAGELPAPGVTPQMWYLNLVYYTGPVRDAQALIDWVASRRHTPVTGILVTDIQLMRWRCTRAGMLPVTLASERPPQA